ncbi:hypothetical protein O9K51_03315 [Purpureocillium lavendulum]|uniref:Peptidase S8/S53 domain-containing protein n=1 Tax=Purpureocillium lavendulum TaxID=1247861 RepID=A0AB34FZU4_9HYPO|nr:hypothetical protein O9K51_03315 [Purpureocillium lavendulum]
MALPTAMAQVFQEIANKPRKTKLTRKAKVQSGSFADTSLLLGFIETGNQAEFKATSKSIRHEDRLKLAEAIVAQYDSEDTHEGTDGNKIGEDDQERDMELLPTPPRSPPQQTREQWLELLLNALSPDPRARRSLAEEVIMQIGRHETSPSPSEQHSHIQQVGHFHILEHIVRDTPDLCVEEDDLKRTLFHVSAINGAVFAMKICLLGIENCCDGDPDHIHKPGCSVVTSLLTSQDTAGHSPIIHAIIANRPPSVCNMLDLLGTTDPAKTRTFLKEAIASGTGNNVDIVRELLSVRHAGPSRKYRTDILEHDILQLAVNNFNFEVFGLLIDIGGAVLAGPDCSLIHYAVYKGQAEAAKYLLTKFPDLATQRHVHPDHTPEPDLTTATGEQKRPSLAQGAGTGTDIEEEKVPLLALYEGRDSDLRDLIFETLMQRLPISELREHLVGQTWTGKEISLDVTILAFDPLSLAAFLDSVRSDLEDFKKDTQEKLRLARDTSEEYEESTQMIPMAGAPADDTHAIYVSSAGIEFERILKYINIPFFRGQTGEGTRRTEAASILQWLKVCKRVKRIFEITVDDCRHCPTTEEDIELALQDLGVEHLDWRRTDLSIRSISGVASDLKTLHLYSSGNLAAIDHWIGPTGVDVLNLDRLYIHIIQDNFVSEARANLCKKICEEAKLKVTPHVTIEPNWIPEPAGHGHLGPPGFARKQSPIEVTGLTYFVQHFMRARLHHLRQLEHELTLDYDELDSPFMLSRLIPDTATKVAILDSGVNGSRFPMQRHSRHGRSFVWRDNGKGHQSEASWWLAVDPHGSHMANIISQLDPLCTFYFFQIADNMNYIELPTVVKALEFAVKCNVDIINCSFALDSCSDELEAVLRKAKEKHIIVMCSTADEGENIDEVWPAAYYRWEKNKAETFENIFPIVGCDEHGKFSKYANEEAGRYMFRGEDVDVSSTDPDLPLETASVQGSSVATALATGVASLILSCYHMVEDGLKQKSNAPDLVDACFVGMSEQLRKGNGQDRPKLLVKPSNLLPAGEDDFRDPRHFLEYMTDLFDEIS